MILGIGHYNVKQQDEFVRYMVAAFAACGNRLCQRIPPQLVDMIAWSPHDVIIPGITTELAFTQVKARRGLLLKIVHPGVAPVTARDCDLLDYNWDYVLGVNGDSASLIADAQEFADWLCGHACRPDQSATARQAALQIEMDAINDNVS